MLFNTRFSKGTSRYVLVIPFLNIVLKFPVVSTLYKTLEDIIYGCETATLHNTWPIAMKIIFGPVDLQSSIRWNLLRGIIANWREYRFYRTSHNPFLWPTYFSLFGLINVQPFATHHPDVSSKEAVWDMMYDITHSMACDDGHTFREMSNYAIDVTGHFRIIDYAKPIGQAVISKFGEQIYIRSRAILH